MGKAATGGIVPAVRRADGHLIDDGGIGTLYKKAVLLRLGGEKGKLARLVLCFFPIEKDFDDLSVVYAGLARPYDGADGDHPLHYGGIGEPFGFLAHALLSVCPRMSFCRGLILL